ncbi:MAG TPA: arsenate reductase ArsC [Nitrococcus sp.]|nr:arsenate reductase ArsC [Nitrococcus sp.]
MYGNSARSVLAEASLRAWGGGRFEAFSAGSRPVGRINLFALAQLAAASIATVGLRSKSWDEFAGRDAPSLDVVVTVCDSAAAEVCPAFLGAPVYTHWGLCDPAAIEGGDEAKRAAFAKAHALIRARLLVFLALPDEIWPNREALQQALEPGGGDAESAL